MKNEAADATPSQEEVAAAAADDDDANANAGHPGARWLRLESVLEVVVAVAAGPACPLTLAGGFIVPSLRPNRLQILLLAMSSDA